MTNRGATVPQAGLKVVLANLRRQFDGLPPKCALHVVLRGKRQLLFAHAPLQTALPAVVLDRRERAHDAQSSVLSHATNTRRIWIKMTIDWRNTTPMWCCNAFRMSSKIFIRILSLSFDKFPKELHLISSFRPAFRFNRSYRWWMSMFDLTSGRMTSRCHLVT